MEFMDKLFEDITLDTPLDMERMDQLKAQLKRESELKQKKWLIAITIYCLLGLGMMLGGALIVHATDNIQFMFYGSFFFIMGFETTVLVKLAYGNLSSLTKILQTLREVQVSVLEHLNAQSNHHNGRSM